MRIKIATLSLAFTDLILFVACGLSFLSKPAKDAPKREQLQFVIRSYSICAMLLICLLITMILVWVWMQNLREELHETTRQNLEALIEGTLQDHEKKPS
jgi:protein-S-isoprenylcysteine O-methyltransferase Ste14